MVATPEITIFELEGNVDWVLLGCDGIFDVLSNEEINEMVWETIRYHRAN